MATVTNRRDALTLPRTRKSLAFRTSIGLGFLSSGISRTNPLCIDNRFTVTSPSIAATTMSPLSASGCPSKSLPAAELESAVIDQIRCIATDEGLIRDVIDQSKKTVETEIAELQRQVQNYKKQLARDHAEIQRIGAMANPNDPTLSRLADLHDRTAIAESELHGLRSRMSKLQEMRLADAEVRTAFGDFERMWHTLTIRKQVKLVRVLVERMEYDPSDTSVSVSFHATAIQSLSGEGVDETTEVSA